MTMPKVLKVFSDYICPWCYFSTRRIEEVRENFNVKIQWIAFPLHPETPPEGLPLQEIYGARVLDMPKTLAHLQALAESLGLPMAERTMTYNSRLAQELGKWAESQGKGGEFHDAVFRAYFGEGKNISKPAVLAALAKSVGLPEKEARAVLKQRTFKEAVDADWSLCEELGVRSVPTFAVDDEAVVGAQPYEVLEKLLLDKGAKKRKAAPKKQPSVAAAPEPKTPPRGRGKKAK
jgi:predicted DsbA family dithiol-disulfide isomerase